MVSQRSLGDSKSPQVSRTLHNILADLNNSAVEMFSNCPLISESPTPFTNRLAIVPSAPTTNVTFIFNLFSLCSLLGRKSPLLSWFFFFFFFFFCLLSQGRVVWLRLGDPFVSQNIVEMCASHSQGWILDRAYTTLSYAQIKKISTTPYSVMSCIIHFLR